MLHLSGGIAFGMDVGKLFELERPFQSQRIAMPPAKVEEIAHLRVLARNLFGALVQSGQARIQQGGQVFKHRKMFTALFNRQAASARAPIERHQGQHKHLATHGLGGGHADFRPRLGIQNGRGLAGYGRAHHIAQAEHSHAVLARDAQGRQGIGRFAALADDKHHVVLVQQQGVAVAKLRSDLYLHGHTRPMLQQMPPPQPRMIRRAAGHNMQTARHGKIVQFGQAHLPLSGMGAAGEAVGDDARLLENFLEHKVAITALLRGLHVPLDGLRFVAYGAQICNAQYLVAVGCSAHKIPVLQKDHLTGVGQECRNVRRHKVFACAQAENKRSGHARGVDDAGFCLIHKANGVGPVGLAQGSGKSV